MRSIFSRTRGIGVRLLLVRSEYGRASHDAHISESRSGAPGFVGVLNLGDGDAGGGEGFFVDDDEEAFGAGEDGAVGGLDFGVVEALAAGGGGWLGWSAEMAADEDERLVERDGAEVVDPHVAGHGEDVERAVEL